MSAVTRALSTLALAAAFIAAGCQPDGTTATARPGFTGQPGSTGSAGTAAPPVVKEPNVITGRVTTEQGQPIAGAQMRIVGYTGGATLGQEFETVTTDAGGVYRLEVPTGLYEVLGQAPLEFDGQTYAFVLEPADGSCEQQMSDAGITKDFTLRLTGLVPCIPGADPDDYPSYHGAAIQLFDRTGGSHSSAAEVAYVLEPIGPLADGSSGETLTLTRTFAALQTSAGPIESTWILHDIPLGRYRVTATATEPGGSETRLLVSTDTATDPATEVEVTFEARSLFGEPAVGYAVPQVLIHDAGGAG